MTTLFRPGHLARAFACSAFVCLAGESPVVRAVTLDFDGAADGAFTSYSQAGFAVEAQSPQWAVSSYGNPPPFIQFVADAGSTLAATIDVARGGSLFKFVSVDLYASTTPIPYLITGSLNSHAVFSLTGTMPNTFGGFATLSNLQKFSVIDSLEITLYNEAAPCCSNPMGLDNIVVTRAAAVPEASMLSLFGLGLAGLGAARGLRRKDSNAAFAGNAAQG